MLLEIAQIDVKPGTEAQFEAAVAQAKPLFVAAKGYKSFGLVKSVELPQRYRLVVGWETLESHTVDFRESAAFPEWRKLVSDYFAVPPVVEHVIDLPGLELVF